MMTMITEIKEEFVSSLLKFFNILCEKMQSSEVWIWIDGRQLAANILLISNKPLSRKAKVQILSQERKMNQIWFEFEEQIGYILIKH